MKKEWIADEWQNDHLWTYLYDGHDNLIEYQIYDWDNIFETWWKYPSKAEFYYSLIDALSPTNELSDSNNSIIFPNPSSGLFHVILDEKSSYFQIYNVTGALLLKQGIEDKTFDFDIGNFPKGVYFLKLENGKVFQLVKE